MRVRFVLSEMATGMRRNLTLTITVVLTVFICLSLLGGAWLLHQQVSVMKGYWYDKIEVSVYLTQDSTQAQKDAILTQLHDLPQVERVYFESHREAFQHAKQLFKDSPDLLANITPKTLPESFRVKLKDPRKYAVVSSAVAGQPGVDQVRDEHQVLDKFFRLLGYGQIIVLFVAAVMLVIAIVLVANAVRVAAFSRRRETGIMRLVGASNVYIQLPFVLEGALAGLIGSLVACGGLAALVAFAVNERIKPAFKFTGTAFIDWGTLSSLVPVLVAIGVVLAAGSSMITLQRYLRV
jgi:cell division transport system permease protein